VSYAFLTTGVEAVWLLGTALVYATPHAEVGGRDICDSDDGDVRKRPDVSRICPVAGNWR